MTLIAKILWPTIFNDKFHGLKDKGYGDSNKSANDVP
jgi:hypothetical protein